MKIFITLKTKMYHGTNKRASTSILKEGFNLENNNCATQNIEHARGYGEYVVEFDWDYKIQLNRNFFYNLMIFLNKEGMVGVTYMKPPNMKIV